MKTTARMIGEGALTLAKLAVDANEVGDALAAWHLASRARSLADVAVRFAGSFEGELQLTKAEFQLLEKLAGEGKGMR
jgi:hypothetical protein